MDRRKWLSIYLDRTICPNVEMGVLFHRFTRIEGHVVKTLNSTPHLRKINRRQGVFIMPKIPRW